MLDICKNYIHQYIKSKLERDTFQVTLTNINQDFLKIIIPALIEKQAKHALIICDTDVEAQQAYLSCEHFLADNYNIFYYPIYEQEHYSLSSANVSNLTERMYVLNHLASQHLDNKDTVNCVIFMSIENILEKLIPIHLLQDNRLSLTVGDKLEISQLIALLNKNNYQAVSQVYDVAQYSIRGDIVDIYTINNPPLRISFDNDCIEYIKTFNLLTQETIDKASTVNINLALDIVINPQTIAHFIDNYQHIFKQQPPDEYLEMLNNGIKPVGIEHYLSLFYQSTDNILDYLPSSTVLFLPVNYQTQLTQLLAHYQEAYTYQQHLAIHNKQDNKQTLKFLKPDQLFYNDHYIMQKVQQHNNFFYSIDVYEDSYNKYTVDDSKVSANIIQFNFKLTSIEFIQYKNSHKTLYDAVLQFLTAYQDYKIVIILTDLDLFHQLEQYLANTEYQYNFIVADIGINNGFIWQNLLVITEKDLTGRNTSSIANMRAKHQHTQETVQKMLLQLSTLKIGDIVVHNKHGIGEYVGIKRFTVNNSAQERDLIAIKYKKDEILYVPVENIDLITKYGANQDNVELSTLGSVAFEKQKNKIKEQANEIAYKLLELEATRKLQTSPILDYDLQEYKLFENQFPYQLTVDQKKVMQDIFADFSANTPADRLVCGDVGFGKTEIAFRASFLIASSGYQVAVVVPTSLLSRQHYNNFCKRFENFPYSIVQLSRFVSASEKKYIKQQIQEGKIDIVIGTHALLSKDMKFNNLGLIIVDEEQSFGVLHKEKLKTMQKNAHVVTLTATPIPRTIQLAFKGVKQLSMISTPPSAKLPTYTYIIEANIGILKQVIERELKRNGQVYYVCQRIKDIPILEKQLLDMKIPDITYISLHGQMNQSTIEDHMLQFQNQNYNILISTNIIEAGLDLSNVNTIIIHNAHLFGIAQLYQLRGRVGRSNKQSYAYLCYENKLLLSDKAKERLQIIQKLDYLGAGFSLASYDLELRGAGNLLGEQQSGHMKSVGSELYFKLLEKEILEKKQHTDSELNYYKFSPEINIDLPVFIPNSYIADLNVSMEIYQRLGKITTKTELDALLSNLTQRFGNPPLQILNLFLVVELKLYCLNANIDDLMVGKHGFSVHFYNNYFPYLEQLMDYLYQNYSNQFSFKPNHTLVIQLEDNESMRKINQIKSFLINLVEICEKVEKNANL